MTIQTGLRLLKAKDDEIYTKIHEIRDLMYERRTLLEMIKEKDPEWIDHVINTVGKLDFLEVEIYI